MTALVKETKRFTAPAYSALEANGWFEGRDLEKHLAVKVTEAVPDFARKIFCEFGFLTIMFETTKHPEAGNQFYIGQYVDSETVAELNRKSKTALAKNEKAGLFLQDLIQQEIFLLGYLEEYTYPIGMKYVFLAEDGSVYLDTIDFIYKCRDNFDDYLNYWIDPDRTDNVKENPDFIYTLE